MKKKKNMAKFIIRGSTWDSSQPAITVPFVKMEGEGWRGREANGVGVLCQFGQYP